MANLLQDLLPDAPREASILAAAVQKNVAGMLRANAEHGLDGATSVRLATAALAASTAFGPASCEWAVRELAVAMGLLGDQTAPTAQAPPAEPPTASPALAGNIGPTQPPAVEPATIAPAHVPWQPPASAQTPRPRRRSRTFLMAACLTVVIGGAAGVGYWIAGSSHSQAAVGSHHLVSRDYSHGRTQPASSSAPASTSTPASASNPASASTSATAPPDASPDTSWIAQLASVDQSAGTAKLDDVLSRVQAQVPQALVLDSSQYASLRPGYWVIYYQGNFANGVQALNYCAAHGLNTRNQCIGRYLSHDAADIGYQCYPPAINPSGNCYFAGTTSSPVSLPRLYGQRRASG